MGGHNTVDAEPLPRFYSPRLLGLTAITEHQTTVALSVQELNVRRWIRTRLLVHSLTDRGGDACGYCL